MDDQQRARGLLPADAIGNAYEFMGEEKVVPVCVAFEAITAALRAAPEGFAVSPEDPTREMVNAGLLFDLTPNQACAVYQSMLAARPQGVKDA